MSIYKSAEDSMGVTYEVMEHIATLGTHPTGWTKQLNIVDWNGNGPKYDVRDWSPDYHQMGRGVVFTKDEIDKLVLGFMAHVVSRKEEE